MLENCISTAHPRDVKDLWTIHLFSGVITIRLGSEGPRGQSAIPVHFTRKHWLSCPHSRWERECVCVCEQAGERAHMCACIFVCVCVRASKRTLCVCVRARKTESEHESERTREILGTCVHVCLTASLCECLCIMYFQKYEDLVYRKLSELDYTPKRGLKNHFKHAPLSSLKGLKHFKHTPVSLQKRWRGEWRWEAGSPPPRVQYTTGPGSTCRGSSWCPPPGSPGRRRCRPGRGRCPGWTRCRRRPSWRTAVRRHSPAWCGCAWPPAQVRKVWVSVCVRDGERSLGAHTFSFLCRKVVYFDLYRGTHSQACLHMNRERDGGGGGGGGGRAGRWVGRNRRLLA